MTTLGHQPWHQPSRRGDTLIEALFAFAILATLIGLAFSGVISAHKSATAGLERTQALEAAQYEAEALKMYRSSLPWDDNQGVPSFLGTILNSGSTQPLCMITQSSPSSSVLNWVVNTNLSTCHGVTSGTGVVNAGLASLNNNQVRITPKCIIAGNINVAQGGANCATANAVEATVVVSWTDVFKRANSVTNIVIVTKNQ